jgi:hypothetical protein
LANCIDHERCPACAKRGRDNSGNNLGVYDDGSKYCFSCHYYCPPTGNWVTDGRSAILQDEQRSLERRSVKLPQDAMSVSRHIKGIDWLLQYGLTMKEIFDNLILFSEKGVYLQRKDETVEQLVIFPFYGNADELIFWTGRNLAYTGTGTKWVIKGKPANLIHGIYPDMYKAGVGKFETCCVCEDVISAIKLGRIVPTFALFGKNINERLLKYLSVNFSVLLIYLDFDAVSDALALMQKMKPYFDQVRVIVSTSDPKCYGTEELRDILK